MAWEFGHFQDFGVQIYAESQANPTSKSVNLATFGT
jgi:hypothetical protein